MYEKIIDALRRGEGEAALAQALASIAQHPQDAQAYRWLAAAQQMQGQPHAALDSISRAIALAPDDSDLHLAHAGLLLGTRRFDDAQAALSKTSALNPNDFAAYLTRAQLALSQGDLDEAARFSRLAARVEPDHPQLASVEGMLALRRDQAEEALKIVNTGLKRQPSDPQLLFVLGLAYQRQGHWAFAEQALRRVLEAMPANRGLHSLIADLLNSQGRHAEAADELAPLLSDVRTATVEIKRYAGSLRLSAGQFPEALPLLRDALIAQPDHAPTLQAIMHVWRQLDADHDARATLDHVLGTLTKNHDLWRSRLELEDAGSEAARNLAHRWVEAMPGHVPALEVQMAVHDVSGQAGAAEAIARRIVEIAPASSIGQQRLVQAMFERDPAEALVYLDTLVEKAVTSDAQLDLQRWKAKLQDLAGHHAEALAIWMQVAATLAPSRLPLWQPTAPRARWPALAAVPDAMPRRSIFLFGTPGSGVESVAAVMSWLFEDFRADRFSPAPPIDGFQNYNTAAALDSGALQGRSLVDGWRAALPSRGSSQGHAIDWLVWWDNALLHALRPHLLDSLLLFALRDPRDMLVDWLAFEAVPPLAFGTSANNAAQWLAVVLEQVATLHELDLFPHKLIKLDGIYDDPAALAALIGDALDMDMQEPLLRRGPKRFDPGHWRGYAEVLAEPFALLGPVAVRLGYPEN